MHELADCQSLLREVERVASAHGNLDVTAIVVAVGPLSGVEAPLLTRAFSVARAGTIAEHAVLEIETMPVTVWCKDCGVQTEVRPDALRCGNCDAGRWSCVRAMSCFCDGWSSISRYSRGGQLT